MTGPKASPKENELVREQDNKDELSQNSILDSEPVYRYDRNDDISKNEDGLKIENANNIVNEIKEEELNAVIIS